MTQTDMIVTLTHVSKRYGSIDALRDVSLTVHRGELLGLIGPDGAGKTTSVRVMCGLIAADRGEVRVLGHDPVREHRAVTRGVGYLSQRFSLYGDLSVDENLAFFAAIHGVTRDGPLRDRLLDVTRLGPFRGRLAAQLSGGMKQKLALACTLVHEPELLLLDEPTTGVDPVSRREFWSLLSELRGQGTTIVLTTPYLDEAERCSRVGMLHEGRLVALDDPRRLRGRFADEVIEVVARPFRAALERLRGLPEVVDAQAFGERAHVRFTALRAEAAVAFVTRALGAAGITVESARSVTPSLEDVYIEQVSR